jgi:hypothetical protein
MQHYAFVMYETENDNTEMSPEILAGHEAFPDRVTELGGAVVAGMAFHPSYTSTTLRGGVMTDGPFLESKEVIAGITIVTAADLDQAMKMAAHVPIVSGGVEVRPLLGFQAVEAS